MFRLLRLPVLTLAALTLILSVTAIPGCSSPSTPEDTAVRFIAAFAEGDVQEALELIHFPEHIRRDDMAMSMANGKIMQMVATGRTRISAKGGLRQITPMDTTASAGDDGCERAAVRLRCEAADGTVSEDVVHLIRIADEWKVDLRV